MQWDRAQRGCSAMNPNAPLIRQDKKIDFGDPRRFVPKAMKSESGAGQ
ncbi:hypothetical protein ANI02nite_11340 [Acetobacter nitrogenifigens DSM 23921 = NBRC 105050]|uniref:Uncharacterized protein n=1 Tax=Acetobacter nitrogenifigens DSM 23921 = NBRC 105050 TaxID=1120919 RepID=A0A511X8H2_9PROT|nr:hypothetical protein ANI02nite_11340 [Acetobacter nitrogenifigens DSM 23921 = NBRC 105050]